jgi:serine phosphatase RsbU (regulator of sigma subunit)/DNA-binding NarL/FixJ family response regulator
MYDKILIADKGNHSYIKIKELLKDSEFEISYAKESKDIFSVLETYLPDIIMIDVDHPEENGTNSLQKLKKHPVFYDIPVIIISDHTNEYILEYSFTFGADDILTKPIDKFVLQLRLKAVFDKLKYVKKLELHRDNLKMQRKLAIENEDRAKKIMETVQAGILLIEADTFLIKEANNMATEMFESISEDFLNRDYRDITPKKIWSDFNSIIEGKKIYNEETEIRTILGNRLNVLRSAVPITIKEKNFILESYVDITTQKRNEAKLRQQKSEIETLVNYLKKANSIISDSNVEISKKNRHITESIKYAKRIQKAVLTNNEAIKHDLPEHFVLLKPKDIVSGDFYLFRKIENEFIFAAVDCTGHGVPGAFMSMLAFALINEIITKRQKYDAGDVLNNLRDQIRNTLGQSADKNSQNDGFDIAYCSLNTDTYDMQFSGAHNPLYIIRNKKLIEIKGDRMPISFTRHEKPFTNHNLKLQQGDNVYLFSDGYIDQFGGKKGRKFMYHNFKKLLLNISEEDMETQREILLEKFHDWTGKKYRQIDDILIMGVKIQ